MRVLLVFFQHWKKKGTFAKLDRKKQNRISGQHLLLMKCIPQTAEWLACLAHSSDPLIHSHVYSCVMSSAWCSMALTWDMKWHHTEEVTWRCATNVRCTSLMQSIFEFKKQKVPTRAFFFFTLNSVTMTLATHTTVQPQRPPLSSPIKGMTQNPSRIIEIENPLQSLISSKQDSSA